MTALRHWLVRSGFVAALAACRPIGPLPSTTEPDGAAPHDSGERDVPAAGAAGRAGSTAGGSGTAGRGVSGGAGGGGTGGAGAPGTGGAPDAGGARDAASSSDVGGTGIPSTGCEIVTCATAGGLAQGGCCNGWGAYASDQDLSGRTDLVEQLARTTTAATAKFRFEKAGQNGQLTFVAAKPRRISRAAIQAVVSGPGDSPLLYLEQDPPASGCSYFVVDGIADLANPRNCWGNRDLVPDHVSVRTRSSGAGAVTLSVRSVDLQVVP